MPITGWNKLEQPRDEATESDILDLTFCRFADDVKMPIFRDPPIKLGEAELFYITDKSNLRIYGALKDQTDLTPSKEHIQNIELICQYQKHELMYGFLHLCTINTKRKHSYKNLAGLSGSPVFHENSGQICGIVVRGGISDTGEFRIWYIDIHDVREALKGSFAPNRLHHYHKPYTTLN